MNGIKFKKDLDNLLKKYNIKSENLKSISINFYIEGLVINPSYEVENEKR